MKNKSFFSCLVLVLIFTGSLFAQMPQRDRGKADFPGKREMLQEKLQLTEDQKEAFAGLRIAHQKEILPLKNKLEILRLDMEEVCLDENPDMNKISNIIDEKSKVKAELEKKNVAHRFKMRSILSDDQKKIWDEHKFDMGFRGPGKMGKRCFDPQGKDGCGPGGCPPLHRYWF